MCFFPLRSLSGARWSTSTRLSLFGGESTSTLGKPKPLLVFLTSLVLRMLFHTSFTPYKNVFVWVEFYMFLNLNEIQNLILSSFPNMRRNSRKVWDHFYPLPHPPFSQRRGSLVHTSSPLRGGKCSFSPFLGGLAHISSSPTGVLSSFLGGTSLVAYAEKQQVHRPKLCYLLVFIFPRNMFVCKIFLT